MLLLDVNILLPGLRPELSDEAAQVREWLEDALNGHERIGLAMPALTGLVRIATHPRALRPASRPEEAVAFAQALIDAPATTVVTPGQRHWQIFTDLVTTHRLRGNDVPDAHLAALALEAGATMVTRDAGFRRFSPLRVLDPLA